MVNVVRVVRAEKTSGKRLAKDDGCTTVTAPRENFLSALAALTSKTVNGLAGLHPDQPAPPPMPALTGPVMG